MIREVLAVTLLVSASTTLSGSIIIQSTNSPAGWLGTGAAPAAGWESDLGFDTSGWNAASDVNSVFTSSWGGHPWNFIWWDNAQSGSEGWFRFEFSLTGALINPVVHGFFDDDGELYFNGNLIWNDTNGVATNALTDFDISPYLVSGSNLIAFHVKDFGGNKFGGVRLDADGIIPGVVPEASSAVCWAVLLLGAGAGVWIKKLGARHP